MSICGAGANENSLIGAGRSMIVENDYGYQSPASVEGGQVTTAGFARVDLNRAGTGVGYNNNYSGIAVSPAGTEYVGTLGGIIALRDG